MDQPARLEVHVGHKVEIVHRQSPMVIHLAMIVIISGWVIINKKLHQETRPNLWKKMSSLGSPLMNQSAKKTSKQY